MAGGFFGRHYVAGRVAYFGVPMPCSRVAIAPAAQWRRGAAGNDDAYRRTVDADIGCLLFATAARYRRGANHRHARLGMAPSRLIFRH